MRLNPFASKLNSASTQAQLDTAREEIMKDGGDFSNSLKVLADIAKKSVDSNFNQTGHGVEALEAIEDRLHKASINPEQVAKETLGRLEQIGSVEAKGLSEKLLSGRIIVSTKPNSSNERNLGETLAQRTL